MRALLIGLVGAALVAGCAAPAAAPPTATPTPIPPPGTVRITGDVRRPADVTADQLAHLPPHMASVEFTSSTGTEHRTESGALLADLLPPDALATTDRKGDLLSFAVLAVGADGYSALVSYGEISPDFGNRGLLLSTREDGAALARPRLVVPGDRKGGRYVSDVVELRVIRASG